MSINDSTSDTNETDRILTEMRTDLNKRYADALLPLTVIFGALAVIGLLGNIAVILIYGKGKRFKDRHFQWGVICLAVTDLFTCVTIIPSEIVKHRNYFSFEEDILCKSKCFMNIFVAVSALCCLMVIGIDRYLHVCYPVVARCNAHQLNTKLLIFLCVFILLFGIAVSFPSVIMCGTNERSMKNSQGANINVFVCEVSPTYERSIFRYVYRFGLLFLYTIINLVLLTLYTKICLKIKHRWDNEPNMHPDEHMHVNVQNQDVLNHQSHIPSNVKLLLLVTIIFNSAYYFYLGLSFVDITKLSTVEFFIFSLFYRSYFVQSVINPVLCLKMDSEFRISLMSFLKTLVCYRQNK
ncbi:hypothetical protein ACJMK2_006592 [Sinanodonta woodiana]|uniref:G-protein coupled receptors family 1 profile domain-containing protein n=1 Tax=Sinanodonta woodiana TaxID=1069815 RepID=A0ABD3VTM2_SINWO